MASKRRNRGIVFLTNTSLLLTTLREMDALVCQLQAIVNQFKQWSVCKPGKARHLRPPPTPPARLASKVPY
ncbi:hypothetical protein DPMN_182904 [Dreissena polymorpha]|uniref:Uncharacterized protein n=1 Tax=Dreissena polymorpha TaxID=45954 RepID=A0A9D4DGD5_DREPO|nr:hypothetical protein DPMN_182904 [Dreissena polymorpha]